MNISFYTAAVGAEQQQKRLDVHANNIANVNTFGFRARVPAFSALMTGTVSGIEEDLQRGVGSKLEDDETDMRTNALSETGRALDYAIEGDGFFAVQDPASGEIYYTRDGSFTKAQLLVTSEGDKENEPTEELKWFLTDGLGRLVLDNHVNENGELDPQPIELPEEYDISTVGAMSLPIGVFDFINRNGVVNYSENRLQIVEKNGNMRFGSGRVVQGYLEFGNVDLANELAKVIESQRSFQFMLRMVTTSDEIESTVNSLRT